MADTGKLAGRTRPTAAKARLGVSELRVAVDDGGFDSLVEALKAVLTIPEFKGFKGCRPCRSGIDRIVIEDPAWREVNRQF